MKGRPTSEQTRGKLRSVLGDPARRAEISASTKQRMADPAVRERIRDGMRRRADAELAEIEALRTVWIRTRPSVRARFIREVFEAGCATPITSNAEEAE